MQVRDAMTGSFELITPDFTIEQAAQKMRELDVGFLPVGNNEKGKLEGVLTDRDIVVRAVAEGKEAKQTPVSEAHNGKVLYCYQSDDLQTAADYMHDQQVYRLIVLDNPDSKQLCGVISLNDILRNKQDQMATNAAEGIARKVA